MLLPRSSIGSLGSVSVRFGFQSDRSTSQAVDFSDRRPLPSVVISFRSAASSSSSSPLSDDFVVMSTSFPSSPFSSDSSLWEKSSLLELLLPILVILHHRASRIARERGMVS